MSRTSPLPGRTRPGRINGHQYCSLCAACTAVPPMLISVRREVSPPMCGSFVVRFPDDRPSKYFYWDDVPITREQALEQAKGIARAERDRDGLRRAR